eukprot:scaffold128809_cov63-Phaeocystis_antarctica.AAC.2
MRATEARSLAHKRQWLVFLCPREGTLGRCGSSQSSGQHILTWFGAIGAEYRKSVHRAATRQGRTGVCVSGSEGPRWLMPRGWGLWRAESSGGLAHLSSFSLKRSGTKEAVQPSQLRKQSLVGSTLDGWTTNVDIRP